MVAKAEDSQEGLMDYMRRTNALCEFLDAIGVEGIIVEVKEGRRHVKVNSMCVYKDTLFVHVEEVK